MKIKFLAILSLLLISTSCTSTYNRAGPGLVYTDTTDAMAFDNSVKPSKTGEACSHRILFLVTFGDASLQAAKRNAEIKRVASADTKYFNIVGVYGKACTVVRGE